MKYILLVLLIFPVFAFAHESVPSELVDSANRLVERLADGCGLEMGQEYLKVNFEIGDKWASNNSYLVFLSCEDGYSNGINEWVALFSSPSKEALSNNDSRPTKQFFLQAIYKVLGKDLCISEVSNAVQKGSIVEIPCTYWKNEDPHCCPTGMGKVCIQFNNGKLIVEKQP